MDERPASRRKPYASAAMHQRRARILAETRRLIAHGDFGALRIKDVADAAGVAIKTIYGLFGRRELLIAHALLERSAVAMSITSPGSPCLEAGLSRLERTVRYFQSRKVELMGLTAIYFSVTADAEARSVIDGASRLANQMLAAEIGEDALLVGPDRLADLLTRWEFATLFDWSIGRLPDSEAHWGLIHGHLRLLSSVTTGQVKQQIMCMLQRIDGLRAMPGVTSASSTAESAAPAERLSVTS